MELDPAATGVASVRAADKQEQGSSAHAADIDHSYPALLYLNKDCLFSQPLSHHDKHWRASVHKVLCTPCRVGVVATKQNTHAQHDQTSEPRRGTSPESRFPCHLS